MSQQSKPAAADPAGELPPLTSFEQLERELEHLAPHERLRAFHAMPPTTQAEAWLDLRARIDAYADDDLEADDWAVAA